MLCTMHLKKQYATKDGPDSVLWSLGITPIEIYIVNTSPYLDKQRDVVQPSFCLMDADFEDTFMPMMMRGMHKVSEDSCARPDDLRKRGLSASSRNDAGRRRQRTEDGGSGRYENGDEDGKIDESSERTVEKLV